MRRVALIPARGGSKRLLRKNIAEFGGRPMIAWGIESAVASKLFDAVVVSTEDPEIADVAKHAGAIVHQRDVQLANDVATVAEVCTDYLRALISIPDRFCCIYATAALITADDLRKSEALLDSEPKADVVMGVSEYPIHPYKAMCTNRDRFLRPQWPAENKQKSQTYPDFVASNGTICWARAAPFLANRTFYSERLRGYHIPFERAVDIDTPADLDWARRLLAVHELATPREDG